MRMNNDNDNDNDGILYYGKILLIDYNNSNKNIKDTMKT